MRSNDTEEQQPPVRRADAAAGKLREQLTRDGAALSRNFLHRERRVGVGERQRAKEEYARDRL